MVDRGVVALDTTVISNFASSSSVGWLTELIERPVTVPSPGTPPGRGCGRLTELIERSVTVPAVHDEVLSGLEAGHRYLQSATGVIGSEIELIEPEGHPPFHRGELDAGERESLIVAIETSSVLATDDLAARTVARLHDIPVTGSVGLLVLGIDRETIDVETADRWLAEWREQRGYYSPVQGISEVLEE